MAEEIEKDKKKKKWKKPKEGAIVRVFEAPRVTFMRMGRPVSIFRGAYGSIDLTHGTVEFLNGETRIGKAKLSATKLRLAVGPNILRAEGKVRVEEGGVTLDADRLTATPMLTHMRTGGRVRLHSETREAAEELLKLREA